MIVVSFVFLYLGVHGFLHFSKTTTFLFDEKVSATHDFQEFQQKLDHFDSSSNDSFTQRYVVNTDMYNNSHVLIVYIGGEGSLGTSSVERGFHFYLAQTYGAVLAALEHRYYGKSQPYQDLSVEHLKYLSSYQALDDLAYFITYLKEKYQELDLRKVIIVGGSYAGSLSAWFRSFYPHLVDAAIASSGPVFAKEDFFEYDQTISSSLGDEVCRDHIRNATSQIDELIDNNYTSVQNTLGCEEIGNENDTRYVIADVVAYAIQYNNDNDEVPTRQLLCSTMNQDPDNITYAEMLFEFFNKMMERIQSDCFDFSTAREKLKQEDQSSGSRQWWYQSCTEFGFFQTAPAEEPLRSPLIDVNYHRDLCDDVFGEGFYSPDVVNATNERYGGLNPNGTEIAFTNGELDPWHMLSIYPPTITTLTSSSSTKRYNSLEKKGLIDDGTIKVGPVDDNDGHVERKHWRLYLIQNGSHCNDFREPGPNNSISLQKTQNLLIQDFHDWMGYLCPDCDGVYYEPINQPSGTVESFRNPFFIISVIVFGVGILTLIITLLCSCRYYKKSTV